MDKVAHHYHQLLTSLTQRLEQGERNIDALEADARRRLLASGDLNPHRGGKRDPRGAARFGRVRPQLR